MAFSIVGRVTSGVTNFRYTKTITIQSHFINGKPCDQEYIFFHNNMNFQIGDAIMGFASALPNKYSGPPKHRFEVQPEIEFPNDRESVIEVFTTIGTSRKSLFSKKAAIQLYSEIEALASKTSFGDNTLGFLDQCSIDRKHLPILRSWKDQTSFQQAQISELLDWWKNNRVIRKIAVMGISKYRVSNLILNSLRSKETPYERFTAILANPYKFPELNLNECKLIINSQQLTLDDRELFCGTLCRWLVENCTNRGWMCTPNNLVVQNFPDTKQHLDHLKVNYGLHLEFISVYTQDYYEVETYMCDFILENLKGPTLNITNNINSPGITLSSDQSEAIQGVLSHNFSILTGPAGSGKTTIARIILENLQKLNLTYVLCAFTGKASNRLFKSINSTKKPHHESIPTYTIHRIISCLEGRGKIDLPDQIDFILIDEASMVCIALLVKMLKLLEKKQMRKPRIILIGDINQISPISSGSLMEEAMKSGVVPVYRLKNNHRTYKVDGELDGVVINTNAIIDNKTLEFKFQTTNNFKLIPGNYTKMIQLIDILESQVKVNSNSLIVLTPLVRHVKAINVYLQKKFNSDSKRVTDCNSNIWAVGDKVMMIKNNYDIDVMNGEDGKIVDVNIDFITIQFYQGGVFQFNLPTDSKNNEYKKYKSRTDELLDDMSGVTRSKDKKLTTEELMLAYACTIDKSQGSEWDYLIMYIPSDVNVRFFDKHRLYTGLTRSKRCAFIVGDIEIASRSAITSPYKKYEYMSKRLIEGLNR
jgi:hypothetical protein